MKFDIDGITVYFPYEYIYPEQYAYMCALKQSLDGNGTSVLEMPSGTGKTVTLLSFILSYKLAKPETGKLVYCSRTVGEIEKVLEEAKVVIANITREVPNVKRMLLMGLSSRRNLCVHPRVREEKYAKTVDAKCRELTAPWVREAAGATKQSTTNSTTTKQRSSTTTTTTTTEAGVASATMELCQFYESFERGGREALLEGVFTLDDMRSLGEKRGWCPYFLSRHLLNFADVIVYSYQYVIDPKISEAVSKEIKGSAILVFDEAHNIDNVCIDALSVTLDRRSIEAAARNIERLTSTLDRAEQKNASALRAEYERLLNGMASAGDAAASTVLRSGPVLQDDELQQAMPGNMRKAKHFLATLRRFQLYVKERMKTTQTVMETPLAFQQAVARTIALDQKSLRFMTMRLTSLMLTLEITDAEQFTPVQLLCDFATLVATYTQGFLMIIEPYDERTPTISEPVLQFACLDASIAMRPVLKKFGHVIITSGTISPLEMYPRILNFTPHITKRFPMSLARNCVCPMIMTRGSDQAAVSSRYEARGDVTVLRNYGALLVDMCKVVPDGVVCFFPSYFYLEQIVGVWNEIGVLKAVLKQKLIFVETTDFTESSYALENYRKACNNGRGAVLLAVARGKVSEGIDFDHQYGRCVILFGIPYMYTESRILRARLEFLRDQYQIRENEFLTFDAMRTASQCIGRVIRGKTDYGIMIFADQRYERPDKRKKLPQWVLQQLADSRHNMTTDMCVSVAREFLKTMAQPWTQEEQLGRSLWTLAHVTSHQRAVQSGTARLIE